MHSSAETTTSITTDYIPDKIIFFYSNGHTHNMNTRTCMKGGVHEGELLTNVCCNSECITRNDFLICVACAQKEHKNHRTTALGLFINDLQARVSGSAETQFQQESI